MKIRATDMSGRGQLLNRAATLRGGILNGVILLERIIDSYLAAYFTADEVKRGELMSMLFAASNGMPMKQKTVLFKKLLKKNEETFFKENSEFFKDIDYVIEQRNIFAHYLIETGQSAIDDHISKRSLTFVKYLDKEMLIHYDLKTMDSIVFKVESCIETATGLLEQVTRKE